MTTADLIIAAVLCGFLCALIYTVVYLLTTIYLEHFSFRGRQAYTDAWNHFYNEMLKEQSMWTYYPAKAPNEPEQPIKVEYASHYGIELEPREGSAGIDIATPIDLQLNGGDTMMLDTGLRLSIDEGYPDVFYMLVPRSSTGKRGLFLTNTVGIIDHSYRGDGDNLLIPLGCRDGQTFTASKGDRICQIIFFQSVPVTFSKVDKLDQNDRGGFGSTGQ